MTRGFRVYQKKRGNRRTGSDKLGSVGEALFFTVLFLVGCGCLVAMFAWLIVPEWRASHEFIVHKCVVLDKRLAREQRDDGIHYRPDIQIEYQINGETYRTWTYDVRREYSPDRAEAERILNRFTADPELQYVCWYDPSDPQVAVLTRGTSWWVWLTMIVPASFILIGGGGLFYRVFAAGKSAERRADLVRRAATLGPFDGNGRSKSEFPGIPVGKNITNSPGTKLAFRLPLADSSTWTLFVTLTACLFWNAIVSVFVVIAVRGHLRGEPDWLLTAFIIPFVLIGVGLIVFVFRQLLVTTGIGPTLVEISEQPLHPGERYDLFLSQTGRLKFRALEVLLVCEEEATYRQGTDTRAETRRVYQHPVFRREAFEIRRGLPFEAGCEIEVPAGVMHSLKSGHNEVSWRILVKGTVAGWPDYERSFPVIVYPECNGMGGK